ncbi:MULTISPECIES: hypothetical protein [unclassified Micromonospora]|uniref:hypothetical protein n=1 Tax=unclassified Micromonospora TaxID=2617518 RepID=UPI003331C302
MPSLKSRLARMLQNATRRPDAAAASPLNAGVVPPARPIGVARVSYANMPSPRQVDGPTATLPPMQQRYVSRQHPDMRARNRQAGPTPARRGSVRAAVGL